MYDSPEESLYLSEEDRAEGKNKGGKGSVNASTVTDSEGYATATVTITDRYAGDNYQIESSLDPELLSDPGYECGVSCTRSPVFTAWKRAYLEIDSMFKKGAYLTADVPAGATELPVSDVSPFRRGDSLRLIHAPRLDGSGSRFFWYEDVSLSSIDKKNKKLKISPTSMSYSGPEGGMPFLADAVGVVTGNTANDFFVVNTGYVDALFAPAFVEYVVDVGDPVPFLPYEVQTDGSGGPETLTEITGVAQKWFFNLGRPNHQHLLGGRKRGTDDATTKSQGTTTATGGTNWSWMWIQTNADTVSSPVFSGEVAAHELAHQWRVNFDSGGVGGHCNHSALDTPFNLQYNSTSLLCHMHAAYNNWGTCSNACPEFYDGIVAFHGVAPSSEPPSEYVQIRNQVEPVPNN